MSNQNYIGVLYHLQVLIIYKFSHRPYKFVISVDFLCIMEAYPKSTLELILYSFLVCCTLFGLVISGLYLSHLIWSHRTENNILVNNRICISFSDTSLTSSRMWSHGRVMYSRLPISHKNSSNVQTMSEALRHEISIHAKYLKSAKAMLDGNLVSSLLSWRATFEIGLFISSLVTVLCTIFFSFPKTLMWIWKSCNLPMFVDALDDLILSYVDVSDGTMIYQTYNLESKRCYLNLSCFLL